MAYFNVTDPLRALPAASLFPPPGATRVATPHDAEHRPCPMATLLTVLLGSLQKRSDGSQVAFVSQEQCLDFPL